MPRLDRYVMLEFRKLLDRLERAVEGGAQLEYTPAGTIRTSEVNCLCPLAVIARFEKPELPIGELYRIHNGEECLFMPNGRQPLPLEPARHAQALMRLVSDTPVRGLSYNRNELAPTEHVQVLTTARLDLARIAIPGV